MDIVSLCAEFITYVCTTYGWEDNPNMYYARTLFDMQLQVARIPMEGVVYAAFKTASTIVCSVSVSRKE